MLSKKTVTAPTMAEIKITRAWDIDKCKYRKLISTDLAFCKEKAVTITANISDRTNLQSNFYSTPSSLIYETKINFTINTYKN